MPIAFLGLTQLKGHLPSYFWQMESLLYYRPSQCSLFCLSPGQAVPALHRYLPSRQEYLWGGAQGLFILLPPAPPAGWHLRGPGETFVTRMTHFPCGKQPPALISLFFPSGLRLSAVLKVKTTFSFITWVLLQIFCLKDLNL